MARKVFFSFYYVGDGWRASQVRNMGALEGNAPCSDNDWETVKKGGDKAIEKWIAAVLDRHPDFIIQTQSSDQSRGAWQDPCDCRSRQAIQWCPVHLGLDDRSHKPAGHRYNDRNSKPNYSFE
jgi:hypothetical protein